MNKFWRRTQSHKSNNHGSKHSGRLQRGASDWFLWLVLALIVIGLFVL